MEEEEEREGEKGEEEAKEGESRKYLIDEENLPILGADFMSNGNEHEKESRLKQKCRFFPPKCCHFMVSSCWERNVDDRENGS